MARKRMIDPSFWEDEKLGSCDPITRLLFMGLISQADDEGRLKGHPSLLRSIIFPYDESITAEIIEIWLTKLADSEHQLIRRYEVDNQKYIFITNFKKHQTINKPQKSKLPEYYGSNTVIVTEESGSDTAQDKLIEVNRKEVEEKISERSTHNFLPLINQLNLKCKGIWESEQVEAYLTTMSVELIEEALKRSEFKKSVAYALGILSGFESSGFKTLEDAKPKNNVRHFNRDSMGSNGKRPIPINNDTSPSVPLSEERKKALIAKAILLDSGGAR